MRTLCSSPLTPPRPQRLPCALGAGLVPRCGEATGRRRHWTRRGASQPPPGPARPPGRQPPGGSADRPGPSRCASRLTHAPRQRPADLRCAGVRSVTLNRNTKLVMFIKKRGIWKGLKKQKGVWAGCVWRTQTWNVPGRERPERDLSQSPRQPRILSKKGL